MEIRQLQESLNEADYLDPFRFAFRPGFSAEMVLVALKDLWWRINNPINSHWFFNHSIFLDHLLKLGHGGTVL